MGLVAQHSTDTTPASIGPSERLLAGVLDWIAAGGAVGAVSLLAQIHGWLAWLLAPFVATALYLLLASLQLKTIVLHSLRNTRRPARPKR